MSNLHSMTAFGSSEGQAGQTSYVCEVKSLNSRFLEVNVRMPRYLMALETDIISAVKKKLTRGKVEVVFNIQNQSSEASLPQLNQDAVKHYLEIYKTIRQTIVDSLGSGTEVRSVGVSDFYRLDGVLENGELNISASERVAKHRDPLLTTLDDALDKLIEERRKEGSSLETAFKTLLTDLETERKKISAVSEKVNSQIYVNYVTKLENLAKKMSEDGLLKVDSLPEDRLAAEISVMADKCDIEEELTRLSTHIVEFSNSLAASEPIGRKLDFLCQEMHREINTMSNKLVQSEATKHTLALKQAVEKIRQQVQNIE